MLFSLPGVIFRLFGRPTFHQTVTSLSFPRNLWGKTVNVASCQQWGWWSEDEQKERLHWFYTTIWMPHILMTKYFYWSVYEGMTHISFRSSFDACANNSSLLRRQHVTHAHSHAGRLNFFAFFPTDFPGKERLLAVYSTLRYITLPHPIHFPPTLHVLSIFPCPTLPQAPPFYPTLPCPRYLHFKNSFSLVIVA